MLKNALKMLYLIAHFQKKITRGRLPAVRRSGEGNQVEKGGEGNQVATLYTPGMDKVIFLDVTECMNHDSGRTGVVVGKFSLIYIFMNVKIQLFLVWEAGEGGSYITFDE